MKHPYTFALAIVLSTATLAAATIACGPTRADDNDCLDDDDCPTAERCLFEEEASTGECFANAEGIFGDTSPDPDPDVEEPEPDAPTSVDPDEPDVDIEDPDAIAPMGWRLNTFELQPTLAIAPIVNALIADNITDNQTILLLRLSAFEESSAPTFCTASLGHGVIEDDDLYTFTSAPQTDRAFFASDATISNRGSFGRTSPLLDLDIIDEDGGVLTLPIRQVVFEATTGVRLRDGSLEGVILVADALEVEVPIAQDPPPTLADLLGGPETANTDTDNDGQPDAWSINATFEGEPATIE